MNVVSSVIMVVLAVIGAASVVREIALRLFCGKAEGTVMYVTCVPGDSGQAEFALRSALARRRWGGVNAVSVVCVDFPMDEKTRKICEGICRDYGCRRLMTKEEFIKSLDYCGESRV